MPSKKKQAGKRGEDFAEILAKAQEGLDQQAEQTATKKEGRRKLVAAQKAQRDAEKAAEEQQRLAAIASEERDKRRRAVIEEARIQESRRAAEAAAKAMFVYPHSGQKYVHREVWYDREPIYFEIDDETATWL